MPVRGLPLAGWLLALLFACASPDGGAQGGGAATAPAPAQADVRDSGFWLFPQDPELSRFVQAFPRSPDPGAALDRLIALDFARFEQDAQAESQWPQARALLLEFYAGVLRGSPELAGAFAARAAAETRGEHAVFCSDVVAAAAAPAAPLRATGVDPLDLLWARYAATADRANVREIAQPLEHALPADQVGPRMRQLASSQPGTPEHAELERISLATTAVFGLVTWARVDPGVRATLREIGREPGHRGEVAASLVASLERPRAPDWVRTSGDFTALVFTTDDFPRLVKLLEHPTESAVYPVTNHAWRGSTVDAVIWFSDCTPGSDGNCRTSADYRVYAPDGSIYARRDQAEFWAGKPPPAKGIVEMAEWTLRMKLEPGDPLGRYVIRFTIRDEVGGHTLASTLELFVEDAAERPAAPAKPQPARKS